MIFLLVDRLRDRILESVPLALPGGNLFIAVFRVNQSHVVLTKLSHGSGARKGPLDHDFSCNERSGIEQIKHLFVEQMVLILIMLYLVAILEDLC